jgi:excisionase family DNA binding protein
LRRRRYEEILPSQFNTPKESQSPITGGVRMLMTLKEIAEETKVSLSQVRRWARANLFPVIHLGHKVKRVRREEYENFLKKRSKG